MTTGDSIGRVQLDIEIPQHSVEREATKAGSVMQRTLGRSLNATRSAITNLFSGLSRAGKAGADSMDSIREKAALLNREMENINDQIGIQEAKLARLREQYQYMSELGMSEDPRALKVQEQIAKAEASIIRLTKASDKTANALWKVDDALTQTGDTSEEVAGQIGASGKQVEKTFTRMGRSATGMSNTIRRAFGQILRRVFLFAVIYKALRGLQDYMGGALKTNAQYARSLGVIKTNLAVAFQPIYQAVLPAVNALMRGLATATTYIAAFFSALGGKSYRESLEAAKKIEEAKQAMDGYGNSAKETRKALMGFDEINVLGAPSANDGAAPQAPEFIVPDTAEAEANASRLTAILQPTITSLGNLWEALKPFKDTIGQGLMSFWKDTIVPFGEWLLEFGLPGFIDGITRALTRLTDWAAANPASVKTMATLILGFFAGLWVYNTTKNIIPFIGNLVRSLKLLAGSITIAGVASFIAAAGFALLVGGIIAVAMNWSKMNGIERTISILGLIAIAATTAAIAVGALQSAWSLGIAAAAIVAGTAAIYYAINSASKRAAEGINLPGVNSFSFGGAMGGGGGGGSGSGGGVRPGPGSISAMATGGFVTAPTLAMVGERSKKEAVLPLEQNTGWADILAEKLAERLGGSGPDKDAPINVIMQVDGATLAKVTARNISELQRQSGKTLIPV